MLGRAGLGDRGLEEHLQASIDKQSSHPEGHNRFLSKRSPSTTLTLDFWASQGFFGGENQLWKKGSEGRGVNMVTNLERVPIEVSSSEGVLEDVSNLEGAKTEITTSQRGLAEVSNWEGVIVEISPSEGRSRTISGDGGSGSGNDSDSDSEEMVEEDRLVELYSSDEFRMYKFKVQRCKRKGNHDWTSCPFAHPGEKARRRDPLQVPYVGSACPDFRKGGGCRRGDTCTRAHGVFECWLHPSRYRTQICKDGYACKRSICFFAHTRAELRSSAAKTSSSSSTFPISSFNCRYNLLSLQDLLGTCSDDLLFSLPRPSLIRDPPGFNLNAFLSSLTSSRSIEDHLGLDWNAFHSSPTSSSSIREQQSLDRTDFLSSFSRSSSIRDQPGLDLTALHSSVTNSSSISDQPGLDSIAVHSSVTNSRSIKDQLGLDLNALHSSLTSSSSIRDHPSLDSTANFHTSQTRSCSIRDQPGLNSNSFHSFITSTSSVRDHPGLDLTAFHSSLPSSSLIRVHPGSHSTAFCSSVNDYGSIRGQPDLDSNALQSSLSTSSSTKDQPGLNLTDFNLSLTRSNQRTRNPMDLDLNTFNPSLTDYSQMAAMRYFPCSSSHSDTPITHSEEALAPYATRVESGRGIRFQMLKNVLEMNQQIKEGVGAESGE